MTGGQMAPTTLIGQKATTCPSGPQRGVERPCPSSMSEMLSTVAGSYYTERVAVNNTANIVKAKKAIAKAFQLSDGGQGLLAWSRCSPPARPTGVMTPVEAMDWLEKNMIPYYPLGVIQRQGGRSNMEKDLYLRRLRRTGHAA